MKILVTCEHFGRNIPHGYHYLFAGANEILNSHRGYDIHAAQVFSDLSKLADDSHFYPYTRLFVEPNRSIGHPCLFSEYTKVLSDAVKSKIIGIFYKPYRQALSEQIEFWLQNCETVLHISVHTFTRHLKGQTRNADIGLLYDPRHKAEREFCLQIKQRFVSDDSQVRVRMNYPYRGNADGLTTAFRKKYGSHYLGLEIEVCNDMAIELKPVVYRVFKAVLAVHQGE